MSARSAGTARPRIALAFWMACSVAVLLGASRAGAELTGVATLETTAPGTAEVFRNIELLASGSGLGALRGSTASSLGLYRFDSDGVLATVADTSTTIPGTAIAFSYFPARARVGDAGLVAFRGEGVDRAGIYRSQAGTVETVADTATLVPGGGGALFTSFDAVLGAGTATVAFRARSIDREGIYLWTESGLVAVADTSTLVPGGGGASFSGFSSPIVSSDRVAFRARAVGIEGIYLFQSGSLSVVADTATVVPGGVATFSGFEAQIALSESSLAFLGRSADREGIYRLQTAVLVAVLETGQTAPGGGVVSDLSPPLAAADEQIAFRADGVNTSALLRLSGGALSEVAAVGSPIPGGSQTLTRLSKLAASNGTVSFRGTAEDYEALYFRDATGLRAIADIATQIPDAATPFAAFDRILSLDASVAIEGSGSDELGVFQDGVPASRAIAAGASPQATIGPGLGVTGGGTIQFSATQGGTLSAEYAAIPEGNLEAVTGIDPATLPFQQASEPIQLWTIAYDGSVAAGSQIVLRYDASHVGNEAGLSLYVFDGISWTALGGTVDAAANRISVDTSIFGIFVLATSSPAIPAIDPTLLALILVSTLAAAMSRSRSFTSQITGGKP